MVLGWGHTHFFGFIAFVFAVGEILLSVLNPKLMVSSQHAVMVSIQLLGVIFNS